MAPAASRPRRPLCLAPSGSPSPEKQPGPRPSSAPAMTSRSPGPGGRLQTAPRLLPGPLASPILVWPGGRGGAVATESQTARGVQAEASPLSGAGPGEGPPPSPRRAGGSEGLAPDARVSVTLGARPGLLRGCGSGVSIRSPHSVGRHCSRVSPPSPWAAWPQCLGGSSPSARRRAGGQRPGEGIPGRGPVPRARRTLPLPSGAALPHQGSGGQKRASPGRGQGAAPRAPLSASHVPRHRGRVKRAGTLSTEGPAGEQCPPL